MFQPSLRSLCRARVAELPRNWLPSIGQALTAILLLAPVAAEACRGTQPTCGPCERVYCDVDFGWQCTADFAKNGLACNDGNACTYTDHCSNGTCAGTWISCNSDQCTSRSCNGGSSCTVTPLTGNPCNDGNACTYGDTCNSGGACVGTSYSCSPNQCQQSASCNGDGTCSYANKAYGTSCNDGNACTYNDHCDGSGNCLGGGTVACVAPCASCNGTSSCTPAPQGTACSDGNACTSNDACNGSGVCVGGPYICCATNADCALPGGVGEKTCSGTPPTCNTPVICAANYTLCPASNTCVVQSGCCTNSDCPPGLTCNGNACSLGCASGTVPCGTTCVATSASVCCPRDN